MTNGNTFGKQAQYGTIHLALGYAELLGPIMRNPWRDTADPVQPA
jgi:hypothetical protein